jgi:polyhydroxyalkanoate synthesis regulator phasin
MRKILETDFAPYFPSDKRDMISFLTVFISAPVSDRYCAFGKYCYFIDNLDFSHIFAAPSGRGANQEKGATMLELLKKGMFAGIGAALLTRDKIREATRMLVEEGRLSSEEAEKLTEDLVNSGEREWEEINSKFQSSFKKISKNLEVVRKKDFEDLKARVELLEQRLSLLEETRSRESGTTGNL